MQVSAKSPLISVIMGVYNCKNKELLKKSVESIVSQTFKDWELIICNDGSSDNTLQYLNEIAEIDSRIKIISYRDNKGLAYALNQCIDVAKGELIARQDDDDVSSNNRFERQVEVFKNGTEYAIVGTNATVFDENGVWGKYLLEEYPTKDSFLWTNPFAHPTVMIEKKALVECGCYRVAKETRRCEDYDLFMRMYSLGYKGKNIQEELYSYQISNGRKKYRPMKYRVDEAIVRFKGYRNMHMGIRAIPFIFKPIVLGLIPQCLFRSVRKAVYSR